MTETRINIRISAEKRQALYDKANSEGRTVTNVLLALIDQYLGDKPSGEIIELRQRIQRLEEAVMGETAA